MLEYYPNVYWPNLLFCNASACGAPVGDLDDANRAALDYVKAGGDTDSPKFRELSLEGILKVADKLERLADEDLAHGRSISAGDKSFRAAAMLAYGELLMTDFYDPKKVEVFDRSRAALKRALSHAGYPHSRSEFVEIPFEGKTLDGLFTPSYYKSDAPVVIHLNGTHSNIEWQYLIGINDQLARRGIASLAFDHPGSGSARYHKGFKYRSNSESYVGAAIDFLEGRKDVDASRVGVCGSSFGGYFAPRAAAFDKRIKACVVWGATYVFPIARYFPDGRPEGALPTAYDEERARQLRWGFGAKDNPTLYDMLQEYTLKGVIDKVEAPLFIVHGKNDPQAPLAGAERQLLEAENSPRAELMVIGPDVGGDMHCNVDNPSTAMNAIGDWLSEVFDIRRASMGSLAREIRK